jgi:microcystin-dependent protein
MMNTAFIWAPPGWVFCTGTIGNAASTANNRKNQDCRDLFIGIYLSYPDTICAVSGGRTGSTAATALADFNAAKTIALPDMRGRTMVALDNLGSTFGMAAAGRVTTQASPDGNTMGGSGGIQATSASIPQMVVPYNIEGGSTSGAQYFSGTFGTDGGNQTIYGGIVGSGDVAHASHTHTVAINGWTQGQALSTHGSWNTYNNAGYATGVFTTMQPFSITTVIIKL